MACDPSGETREDHGVGRVVQQIVTTLFKVIDIALELGYSDPAHFARAFARWTGLAPREFRRLRGTRPNLQHPENPVPVLYVNKLPQAKAAGD
jgi:AraC-like DNA-binding protein